MTREKQTPLLAVDAAVAAGLTISSSLAQDSEGATGKIEYSVESSDDSLFTALQATENGKTYQLIDKSKEMYLQVIDQRDVNGNGFVDALV